MEEFFDNENGYKRWLKENPSGYVLNMAQKPTPKYLVLHHSNCQSINNDTHPPGAFTVRRYGKVCANSIDELEAWVAIKFPNSDGFSARHGGIPRKP